MKSLMPWVCALVLALPQLAHGQLPPLIDREVFFGDPEIAAARISPDGRFISFVKTNNGQMNIWVKKREEPFSAAVPLTADSARPITNYFWSRDSRYVLYVHDRGGDENYHLYAIDPTQATLTKLPVARDLTPYPKVRVQIVDVPNKMPNSVIVMINDRDAAKHDLYRVDLTTGERTLVFRNDAGFAGFLADQQGNVPLAIKLADNGLGTEIFQIQGDRATPLFVLSCDIFQGCAPVRVENDGRIYVRAANAGDNFTHLGIYDPRTKSWDKLEEDPNKEVDFGGVVFSDVSGELLATYYVGDRVRYYAKTPQFTKDLNAIRKAVGDGDIYFGSATADERLHIVSVTSDVDPGATYLYYRQTGKIDLLYRPRPALPLASLAPMKPVRYTARDGMIIPAYLTTPKGLTVRRLPTIILPHGGPWARDTWGYDSFAQFLANRGYAVLQPNFRGSTGFGRKFLDAGNQEWGTGFMQHDLTDAVHYLIKEGIADAKRVAIMGGSYGGYATLAGVAFTPELYAAGVSIVGPSSIPTLLASIPPYWAPIKSAFNNRLGNPDVAEELERLKRQSPLYSATNIRAPLLVIQGANDPRVNKAESDQIVIALRDLKRSPEYLVAPDEGHGFAGRENRVAMFAAIERFLAKHLGGRYQQDMPKDIADRLRRLIVNVDTLALKKPSARSPAKFNAALLASGTSSYKQSIEVRGQKIEGTTTVVLSKAADGWLSVETTVTPMGSAIDSLWLSTATLAPTRRVVNQGQARIEVNAHGDSIVGLIDAGARKMPIAVKTTAPVYMKAGGFNAALATLPLAADYTAGVRLFDLMGGAATEHSIKVIGSESVRVSAGTFEAFKVQLQAADGSGTPDTFWITTSAPHRVVRSEQALPAQMSGGKVVTELIN